MRMLFLLLAAVASCGPLLFSGLPETAGSSGQDVDAAMAFLQGFAAESQAGAWWPHWLMEGNRGFGSPAFLFYPPLPYWAATGLMRGFGLDAGGALLAAAILWRALAALLAFPWLARRMPALPALAGTALFSLHMQNMLVTPLVGFAYAELAGTCALLLGLAAAEARRPLLVLPLAFALLVLTHLPTAVLAGGVLPAWGFVAAGMGKAGLRQAGLGLAGVALGAALAGAYLLPALELLPAINDAGWDTQGLTTWSGHFLLDSWSPSKPVVHFLFMNAGLAVVLVSLPLLAWVGRRRAPVGGDRFFLGVAGLTLLLCLMTTPLAWPVWWALEPLQRVQFPWRLMIPVTAIWAMLAGWRLVRLEAAGVRGGPALLLALALTLGASAVWLPYSTLTATRPNFARYGWTRLHRAPPGPRPAPARHPPEYAPRAAAAAGWRAEDPASDAALQAALARGSAGLAVARRPEALAVTGRLAAPAAVLLPQFAFPGWAVEGRPARIQAGTDPPTGLLRLDLPAGDVSLVVRRVMTPAERLGWALSALAALAWLALMLPGALARSMAMPWREAFASASEQRQGGD